MWREMSGGNILGGKCPEEMSEKMSGGKCLRPIYTHWASQFTEAHRENCFISSKSNYIRSQYYKTILYICAIYIYIYIYIYIFCSDCSLHRLYIEFEW